PIEPQSGSKSEVAGEAVLSIPVDLAPTRQRLSELVPEASLTGVGQPLPLVSNKAPPSAIQQMYSVRPNPDWKLPPLTLVAAIASKRPRWIEPVRYACVALASVMLIMFLFGLRKR